MALDRLTQITSSGISSVSTITVSAIAGVITATTATVSGNLTVGTGVTISSGIITATRASISNNLTVGTGVTIQSGIVSATSYFASNQRRVVALTSGDTTLWYQAAAPVGWTKSTTHNDKALRVVSGAGGGSGGSTAFSSVMASRTPAGSVAVSNAAFTLSTNEMPSHGHAANAYEWSLGSPGGSGLLYYTRNSNANNGSQTIAPGISNNGSSASHTHNNTASFSGTAMDFAVQYIDMIICSID